jgi:apolipoprotein N-acyltransferase
MKFYHKLLLTLLSALFLFLSFKELGFFAWFSLVPFLFAVYKSPLKQSILFSAIAGIGFFAGMTYWIAELIVKYVWPIILVFSSVYFIVTGILIHFILNKITQPYLRIFLVSAAWILIEFLRSQTVFAFTVGILGYSQHYFLPLMQVTRFTGIYGISFILLLFNATIFETIIFYINNKRINLRYFAISLSVILLSISYGIVSFNNNLNRSVKNKNLNELKIAIVQPNISFGNKYSNKDNEITPQPYYNSVYFKPGTELVIFPESALWGSMEENKAFRSWVEKVLESQDIYLLIGQYTSNQDKTEWSNSVILYNPQLEIIARYNEIHPIPFNQYVPFPRILGFLKFLDFSKVNLILGDNYTPFELPGKGKLGINICYESTLPDIARKFRNNGAEAIFVLSDDSSLNDSIAPWHHLIFSKVRAIENGCYVAHCTNTGISALISPDGDIVKKVDLMEKDVIYGSIFLIPGKTFYARFGDLILYVYLGILFVVTITYLSIKKYKH